MSMATSRVRKWTSNGGDATTRRFCPHFDPRLNLAGEREAHTNSAYVQVP